MADDGNKLLQENVRLLNELTKAYDKLDKQQKGNLKNQNDFLQTQKILNDQLKSATGAKEYARVQKEIEGNIKATALAEKESIKIAVEKEKLKRQQIQTEKAVNREIKVQEGSINALRQANRQLTKERNNLNLSSKEGQKRLKELNKQLDLNNKKIKQNSDSLTKQKINIGNYGSALQGLIPSLGGISAGFQSITKASLAFIATPIGAIVGALVLAFKALTTYFNSSEEGQNALNKIMKVGGVIMGNISDIVSNLGKTIFEAFTNPKQAVADLWEFLKQNMINRVKGIADTFKFLGKTIQSAISLDWDGVKENAAELGDAVIQATIGVEDATKKATDAMSGLINETKEEIEVAKQLADLEAKRDLLQRKLIVDQEKLRTKSRELRLKAEQADGQERIDLLLEAFRVEDELARRREEIANINLTLKREENKLSNSTKEDLDEVARLEAELYVIQQQRLKQQLTLQTKINTEQNKLKVNIEDQINSEVKVTNTVTDELQKRVDAHKKAMDKEEEQEAIKEENIKEIKAAAKDKALEIAQEEAIGLLATSGEKAQAEIDQNRAELDAKLEDETLTEERKELIKQQFAAKEKQLKIKKAKADKKDEAFKAIIGGLSASVQALPNLVLSGIVLGQSLATAGTILAKPIPQFDKGTKSLPSLSEVAEKRPELILKDGKPYLFDQPTILGKEWQGSEVISGAETANLMSGLANGKFNDIVNERKDNDRQLMLGYALVGAVKQGTKDTVKAINNKNGLSRMREMSFNNKVSKFSE